MDKPIIGQEAICPDGLGRVVDYDLDFPNSWIKIQTHIKNRGCCWDKANVELINPRKTNEPIKN